MTEFFDLLKDWQGFTFQTTALGGLMWFMRSQSKRQDKIQSFFEKTLNGSLIGVRDALHDSTVAERDTATVLRELKGEIRRSSYRNP